MTEEHEMSYTADCNWRGLLFLRLFFPPSSVRLFSAPSAIRIDATIIACAGHGELEGTIITN